MTYLMRGQKHLTSIVKIGHTKRRAVALRRFFAAAVLVKKLVKSSLLFSGFNL